MWRGNARESQVLPQKSLQVSIPATMLGFRGTMQISQFSQGDATRGEKEEKLKIGEGEIKVFRLVGDCS